MEAITTPTRVPLPIEPKAPSKRKLAERVFCQRPVLLSLGGRKRETFATILGRQRAQTAKDLKADRAKMRRLDMTDERRLRRLEARERLNPRFTMAACHPEPTLQEYEAKEEAPPVRILIEKGVWLELLEEEYDADMDERILVLRYIEGFAGLPAPKTSVAEMRAHARGQQQRRKKEGDTEGMLSTLRHCVYHFTHYVFTH